MYKDLLYNDNSDLKEESQFITQDRTNSQVINLLGKDWDIC